MICKEHIKCQMGDVLTISRIEYSTHGGCVVARQPLAGSLILNTRNADDEYPLSFFSIAEARSYLRLAARFQQRGADFVPCPSSLGAAPSHRTSSPLETMGAPS
jgi:hypothetical protein